MELEKIDKVIEMWNEISIKLKTKYMLLQQNAPKEKAFQRKLEQFEYEVKKWKHMGTILSEIQKQYKISEQKIEEEISKLSMPYSETTGMLEFQEMKAVLEEYDIVFCEHGGDDDFL